MASIYGIENANFLLEDRNEEGGGEGEDSEEGGRGRSRSRSSFQIDNSTPFDDEHMEGRDIEEAGEGGHKKSFVSVATNQEEESEFGSYNVLMAAHLDENNNYSRSDEKNSAGGSNSTGSRASYINREYNSGGSSFGTHSNVDSNSQSSTRRRAGSSVPVVLDTESGEVSELGEDLIRKLRRTSSKSRSLSALTKSNVENLKSAASVMQSKRMGYGLGPSGVKGTELKSSNLAASSTSR